ncbi:MAG: hypothetical protein HY435_03360 [Candidatus Liptonbacteria bacterium]|nr:hypothetical protein [Candidatus Liptonbacteria bacterium]
MNLSELMSLVRDNWLFDEANYPQIRECSDSEQQLFALRHVLMHLAKALGKLSEIVEPLDHKSVPEPPNKATFEPIVRNFLINTLKLADIAGISPEELAESVIKWAREKHVP